MRRFALATLVLLAVSCDVYDFPGMVWSKSPTSDERFAESVDYFEAHPIQTFLSLANNYRVYVATDAHVDKSSPTLARFVSDFRSDNHLDRAPFALYLGDTGHAKGDIDSFYKEVQPLLSNRRDTLFCTAGNHDLYFGQWSDWTAKFHTSSYYFEVLTLLGERDLYICLDSGNGTLGKLQRDWVEKVLASRGPGARQIVVFTHTHFFKKDGSQGHTSNYTLEETYDIADLFAEYGVDLVLTGHDHFREDTVFKGVRYVIVDAIEAAAEESWYDIINIGDTISVSFVQVQ